MSRPKSPTLTDAELRIMNIIWDLGEATVHEVVAAHPSRKRPAYNTVLTTMRILEDKGYLTHEKEGRAHIFRAAVDRQQARTRAIKHMLRGLFDDSPEALMANLLKNEDLSAKERARLRAMITEAERKSGKGDR